MNEVSFQDLAMLRRFIPTGQISTIISAFAGEEGQFFRERLYEVAAAVRATPVTRKTEGVADPIVHLHYFVGSLDAWIIERDVGDGQCEPGVGPQHQAYGYVDMGYGPELGYISLPELFKAGAELDLHWNPVTAAAALEMAQVASHVAINPSFRAAEEIA